MKYRSSCFGVFMLEILAHFLKHSNILQNVGMFLATFGKITSDITKRVRVFYFLESDNVCIDSLKKIFDLFEMPMDPYVSG